MNNVAIYSFIQSSDSYKKWMTDNTIPKFLIMNQFLIKAGDSHNYLYIVNDGLLGLKTTKILQPTIIELQNGDVIGDDYFFGAKMSSYDVIALQSSDISAIPLNKLIEKINSDKLFELDFFKSILLKINNRLNKLYVLNNTSHSTNTFLNKTNDIWNKLDNYLNYVKSILQNANNEYLKDGNISIETKKFVERKILFSFKYLNRIVNSNKSLTEYQKEEIGRKISFEMLPYLLLTHHAERWLTKPNGYAGDYLTIHQIYQDKAIGKGELGLLLDHCFLQISACKAVKNRRKILKNQIINSINSNNGITDILSIACGPAQEIFDCYLELADTTLLKSTLVDIDNDAVTFVNEKIIGSNLSSQIQIFKKYLVLLAKGKDYLDIPLQDIVYSIGLMDYFSDKAVIIFLNYFYKLLKPNGKVIIGNFHPNNDSKALMDNILDWRLIHRTEEQMIEIFSKSLFKTNPVEFVYEEQGINLFAICAKH